MFAPEEPDRAFELYHRLADRGAADAEATEWWAGVLRRHRRAAGAVPLLQIAGLPTTPAGWRLAQGNAAIRRLAALLPDQNAREIAARLDVFATRGSFRRWRREGLPADCTLVEATMFQCVASRDGYPPSRPTVQRALGGSHFG